MRSEFNDSFMSECFLCHLLRSCAWIEHCIVYQLVRGCRFTVKWLWCPCVYSVLLLVCMCLVLSLLGNKHSSASRELPDKCRRHSWRSFGVFRFSREQTACCPSATAVTVSRTISHRYKFVLRGYVLMWHVKSLIVKTKDIYIYIYIYIHLNFAK